MEFRLTYEGESLAHRDDKRLERRSLHVHGIRKKFRTQLKNLWLSHPVLVHAKYPMIEGQPDSDVIKPINRYGFNWLPLVQKGNGLTCTLDISDVTRRPAGTCGA